MYVIENGSVVHKERDTMFGDICIKPKELTAKSHEILPAGLPISSSIFVIDKIDFVWCDGEDNWYREADKPVAAGQPISALF